MIPYDLHGIITAIGGPDAANARLDDYFSHYGGGQEPYFNINNEPSFADPWIYNWTGHPWRAQEVIRKTLSDLFTVEPDGLPGNDDLGATSACSIRGAGNLSCNPGGRESLSTRPLFRKRC